MRYLEHWGQTVHVGSLSIWDKQEIFILRTKYFLTGGTFLLNMYHTFYFHIEALSNVSKCLSDVNEVTPSLALTDVNISDGGSSLTWSRLTPTSRLQRREVTPDCPAWCPGSPPGTTVVSGRSTSLQGRPGSRPPISGKL